MIHEPSSKATPAIALGLLAASGMGAWWLFASETRAPLPVPSPREDLDLVTALLDGATTEPPRDVLVVGEKETYLARASDRTLFASRGGRAPCVPSPGWRRLHAQWPSPTARCG